MLDSIHTNKADKKQRNHKGPSLTEVDLITEGLQPRYNTYLKDESQISRENALVICDYILAMNTEINPSDEYRKTTIQVLIQLSKFLSKSDYQQQKKPFDVIAREDIVAFLDSLRKPESLDPMHKWIGTYNLYNIQLTRFFKWLYSPNIEPNKRQKPRVVVTYLPGASSDNVTSAILGSWEGCGSVFGSG
jgi:hypothetical protein